MQISDLMAELVAMFPRHMTADVVTAQKSRYLRVLGEYQGPTLAAAFATLERRWTKTTPPLPADIIPLCEEVRGRRDRGIEVDNSGPAYNTRERILWDKAWKEAFGLPAQWETGQRDRAEALGYIAHHCSRMGKAVPAAPDLTNPTGPLGNLMAG